MFIKSNNIEEGIPVIDKEFKCFRYGLCLFSKQCSHYEFLPGGGADRD